MLSQDATVPQALLFSGASILTHLVTFLPGGFGLREAIGTAIASAQGFGLPASVAAVSLDRLVSTITVVVLGGISTFVLGKQLPDIAAVPAKAR
jgi:uncharacterized protein (TIRG00374 family)